MFFLDIPERGNAASLTEKLDCVLRSGRGVAVGGNMAWGDSKAPGSVAAAQQHRLFLYAQQQQNRTSTFLFAPRAQQGEGAARLRAAPARARRGRLSILD